ncbi:Nipped-B-like protein B, partial [Durusdinium trenchii]
VAFMCLALPGKQHFGKPASAAAMEGYDSVVGREGQRGVDEWVFFRKDQLLPCFLVDELGLIIAKEAAQQAIKVLHQPWPDEHFPDARTEAPDVVGRWKRRFTSPPEATVDTPSRQSRRWTKQEPSK